MSLQLSNPGGTITLTSGELLIDKDLVIQGPGADLLAISGNNGSRVFSVKSDSGTIAVTISGVTVRDGRAAQGGGIYNEEDLTLEGCIIRDNATTLIGDNGGPGGGIYNTGTLMVDNCTVTGNATADYGGEKGNRGGDGGGIWSSGALTLRGSTVSGNHTGKGDPKIGTGDGCGGGIYNTGTLEIDDSVVSDNYTGDSDHSDGLGGGIYSEGSLEIVGSTIRDNNGHTGGGISSRGQLIITDSTVSGNHGAGIFNAGSTVLTNVTVSGNAEGGLVVAGQAADIIAISHSTITDNTGEGEGYGGGIIIDPENEAEIKVKSTIIAGNHAAGGAVPDCSGELSSYGYNLIGDSTGCTITEAENPGTDIVGVDPLLGPLQDNGGPTETHALLPGSPAIDAGSCTDVAGNPVAEDQRGVARPQGATCDIGAYELEVQIQYTLRVHKAGTGTGTVTSSPAGINCGTACEARFTAGTKVTLTANPGDNSEFAGWSGGASGTGTSVTITMDSDKDVTATFSSHRSDVNGDGAVDVLDVRLCLQIAVGEIPGTLEQRDRADVDLDGDVDIDDACILAEYVIGVREGLP